MADQLKIQLIGQLTEIDTREVHRFMDEQLLTEPKSYYNGKESLDANETDTKIAELVTCFIAYSDKKYTLKFDSVGATPMTTCRMFVYTGDPRTFYISNPNSEAIDVKIITSKAE